MGNFKKGVEKLEKKGYSKDYASSVMAIQGVKKYGQKAMTQKAINAKKAHRKKV